MKVVSFRRLFSKNVSLSIIHISPIYSLQTIALAHTNHSFITYKPLVYNIQTIGLLDIESKKVRSKKQEICFSGEK